MKFLPGPMVGMLSGSVGASVYSRNRYGAYARTRAHPTNVVSQYTQFARANFAAASQAWAGLTEAQRLQWATWAQSNPITDRLGQQQVLAGNAAYVRLNGIQRTQGGAVLNSPPVVNAPDALTSLSGTFDIGAGDFEINFTPTPLGATNKLWTWAAVVNSAGVSYVKNRYKLVDVSAANVATGLDLQSAIEERFGTLIVGQRVFLLCQVSDNATGLQSIGAPVVGTVIST